MNAKKTKENAAVTQTQSKYNTPLANNIMEARTLMLTTATWVNFDGDNCTVISLNFITSLKYFVLQKFQIVSQSIHLHLR